MAADWDYLRTEYVTSKISMRALADKYGVPRSTLLKAATKGKWADARKRYGNDVMTKTTRKLANRQSDKLVALQHASDTMAQRIEAILSDPEQFNRHLVSVGSDGEFSTKEQVFLKADTRALRDMTAALRDMTATVRNLYGLLTDPERASIDMAVARLEIDRAKAGTDDVAGETGVVILAPVDGDADG